MKSSALPKLLDFLASYGLATSLIVGWWFLAFHQSQPARPLFYSLKEQNSEVINYFEDQGLFAVDREHLARALSGDFILMGQLIAEWDVDAQHLVSKGLTAIKRLPPQDYLKSQMLVRKLKHAAETKSRASEPHTDFKRFLPQTYVAASFLLALSKPEEIVALPQRLREQTQMYPRYLTDKIPLDIDRNNSEKLFLAGPEIAFVANYSNPATIQVLRSQGVALYMTKDPNSLKDITDELLQIGTIANRSIEAEMLKIFMEAAFLANDNKVAMLKKYCSDNRIDYPRILFLQFHQNFTVPTLNTMTGQLLKRLDILDITLKATEIEGSNKMAVVMEKERILNLDPDYLIIASENNEALEKEIRRDGALSQLKALKQNKLFFLDSDIQNSPTQYIVLAYHDLIQVLMKK